MLGPALGGLLDRSHSPSAAATALPFGVIAVLAVLAGLALAACPWDRTAGETGSFDAVPLGDAPHPVRARPMRNLVGRARDVWVASAAGALIVAGALSGATQLHVRALLLTAAPRGAINVVAYGVAGRAGTAGSVFGLVNGAWAAATVLTPLGAGALAQVGGARAGYLAVIVPSLLVTAAMGAALPKLRALRARATPAVARARPWG
jgi:MFS family permease